jgi:RNA polymerase sigma-70 factor (ECF subfamily)
VRHQRPVYNLIVRLVRDPATAEELAQDSFVKAFRALHTFDPAHRFSSWMLRIAHNTAIDYLRVRRPDTVPLERDLGDGTVLEQVIPDRAHEDPAEAAERGDLRNALEAAISRLRADYRRLVVLRYQEDLSYEEIAEVTGLPIGTIKSYLHRARAEMARELTRLGWAPT